MPCDRIQKYIYEKKRRVFHMIGADAIIKCLEAEDVKMVFGYPGVAHDG